MSDGRHMLPVKAEILDFIGRRPGDSVTVILEEHIAAKHGQ
jgi:hypothetical protein